MSKKIVDPPKTKLRQQAEEKLKKIQKGKTPARKTGAETMRLVHELEVHQIELQMQNEELIHSRATTEAALDQYTELYDFAPVGYFSLTGDGEIKQVNLSGARLLGIERGRLIKRRFGLFVTPKSRRTFAAFLEKVFSAQSEKEGCELELLKGKTESLWVSMEAASDPAHETCRAVVTDITERKKAEEEIHKLNASLEQRVEERTRELHEAQDQLMQKERLSVLGQLAGSIGIELRTPLSVINNSVFYLKLIQPGVDGKTKEYLDMIEQEVRISERIITDLEDFSSTATVDRSPVSLSKLTSQALEHSRSQPNVAVAIEEPEDLPAIFVDETQIILALGNLITNAYQAMPQGGKLTLSGSLQNKMIALTVQDNGTGIPPENMQRIFDPLFTTKAKHVGMGLPISKKLIEANGGRVVLESEAGKGSTFTMYLPVYKATQG